MENFFVVQPAEAFWFGYSWQKRGQLLSDSFRYSSDNNSQWLDVEGIQKFIEPFEKLYLAGKLEG
jgi:hypothetical protein